MNANTKLLKEKNILSYLRRMGIVLGWDGYGIQGSAPYEEIPDEVKEFLKKHADELAEKFAHEETLQRQTITISRAAPVSPSQERMLQAGDILQHMPQRVEPIAILVEGNLDLSSFEQSINLLIERQEALRTAIRTKENGTYIQLVRSSVHHELEVFDLTKDALAEDRIVEIARELSIHPFDPRKPDLFRVVVVRLTDRRHVLLITIHHLMSDGWSVGLFFRDLGELYRVVEKGGLPQLPTINTSFSQLSSRLQDRRYSAGAQTQLTYWINELNTTCRSLNLSYDHAKSGPLSLSVAEETFIVDIEKAEGLRKISRQSSNAGGLSGSFIAALGALLHIYSGGTKDIRIGTMAANRMSPQTEAVIGFFANVTVIKLEVRPEMQLTELLSLANYKIKAALSNQEVPIQDVVNHLRRNDSFESSNLYQAMFVLNTLIHGQVSLIGTDCTEIELPNDKATAQCTSLDLLWQVTEQKDNYKGKLSYKADLFEAKTAHRIVEDYQCMLKQLYQRSDLTVAESAAYLETGRVK